MALTTLQAQLAQIAAKSTNPLDLKAQRKIHAKSLVFEPEQAASQDFDTLYETCIAGFSDLCQLDHRFRRYGISLFSLQSKDRDRTQITADENAELDKLIDNFLGLVGNFLLLKPGALAVEWLVRRFRILENNTQSVLLAFLPYHTYPMFLTLLSILPSTLPPAFRFLQTFRDAVQNPPRHSIVVSTTQNHTLFAAMNQNVLKSCRKSYDYPKLIQFWAAVTSEAVAGQVDLASTGRIEARRQKQEDVMLRILPTLSEGLRINNNAMRGGCLMIIMILATKIHLSSKTLDAMMEAIVGGKGTRLERDDLVCLSVLAQARTTSHLPRKVLKSLVADPEISNKLRWLVGSYHADRLILGIIEGILGDLNNPRAMENTTLVGDIIEFQFLEQGNTRKAIQALIEAADAFEPGEDSVSGLQEAMGKLTLRLATSEAVGNIVREAIEGTENGIHGTSDKMSDVEDNANGEIDARHRTDTETQFKGLLEELPKTYKEESFLKEQFVPPLTLLNSICTLAGPSTDRWSSIRQHFEDRHEQLFLTLLIRLWCGPFSPAVRRSALSVAKDVLRKRGERLQEDQQFMLPYVLVGLADASSKVRRAAADLFLTTQQSKDTPNGIARLGVGTTIYRLGGNEESIFMAEDEKADFEQLITENLEEVVSDGLYLGRLIQASFRSGRIGNSRPKSLNDRTREAVLSSLAAHIVQTPLLNVQIKLLQILHGVGKVKTKSKTKLLLPLIECVRDIDAEELGIKCAREKLLPDAYVTEVISSIAATNRDGISVINDCVDVTSGQTSSLVRANAMRHVGKIWPSMRPENQRQTASTLLRSVHSQPVAASSVDLGGVAADVLRALSLGTDVFCDFLDELPALVDQEALQSPHKRRRTEGGHVSGDDERAELSSVQSLQRWTFVLELIESAEGRADFSLISRLCGLLNDIHSGTQNARGQFNYILTLLLDACDGVIKDLSLTKVQINPNIIPVEVIIDIFKNSPNPQIQRSSLRLISSLANIFPDVIIHHVMPVFTKMGHSVLQHADSYSIHITETAIQSIIPPLLASFDQQEGGSREGIIRLIVSFVAAFEHMPPDRRVPIFSSLVDHVGTQEALHLLILLFANKFGSNSTAEDFVLKLAALYSGTEQLTAARNAIKIASNAISEYPSPIAVQVLQASDDRARLTSVLHVITLVSRMLQEPRTIRKASIELVGSENTLRTLYSQFSEEVLRLTSFARSNKKLSFACEDLLHSTLRLMPVHESISGLETLLSGSSEEAVIRLSLKSIEERIKTVATGDYKSQETVLGLLTTLADLLQDKEDRQLLQVSIMCVDSIIERFGKKDTPSSLKVIGIIASKKFVLSEIAQEAEISILCIATAAQVLGEAIIPILPKVLPLILEAMEKSLSARSRASVMTAAYTFLAAVLDSVPWALSKSQTESLLRLSAKCAVDPALTDETMDSRMSALELLARRTEPRDSISALSVTWKDAIESALPSKETGESSLADEALIQHIHVIGTVIISSSKPVVTRHSQLMMDFFKLAFDLPCIAADKRLAHAANIQPDIQDVLKIVSETMVNMIYKLNDTSFRPLFGSLIGWATDSKSQTSGQSRARRFSLYVFLSHFFSTLKSIVTSYSGMFVDDAVKYLTSDAASAKQQNVAEGQLEHGLWCLVLETLRHAFDNDADQYFQSPARFGPLSGALVGQLADLSNIRKRLPVGQEGDDTVEALERHVIPTIVSLASAADAAENLKQLNKQILKEARNFKAAARVSAIRCQQMLVEKLAEDWLTNLPEMLPVIGEVLEDEDEDVVGEARRWVRGIEGVLGESLEGMLQ